MTTLQKVIPGTVKLRESSGRAGGFPLGLISSHGLEATRAKQVEGSVRDEEFIGSPLGFV